MELPYLYMSNDLFLKLPSILIEQGIQVTNEPLFEGESPGEFLGAICCKTEDGASVTLLCNRSKTLKKATSVIIMFSPIGPRFEKLRASNRLRERIEDLLRKCGATNTEEKEGS